jgi:hypothetical protein
MRQKSRNLKMGCKKPNSYVQIKTNAKTNFKKTNYYMLHTKNNILHYKCKMTPEFGVITFNSLKPSAEYLKQLGKNISF